MKIKVPEGMLKEAFDAVSSFDGIDESITTSIHNDCRSILEAAIRWLDGELEKLVKGDPYTNDQYFRTQTLNENAVRTGFNKAIAEVRLIFSDPESDKLAGIEPHWNTRQTKEGNIEVCRGEHKGYEGCHWEKWPPENYESEQEIPEEIKIANERLIDRFFAERNRKYDI